MNNPLKETSVTVLFFGPARDAAGVDVVQVVVPDGGTVGILRDALVRSYARLSASLRTMRFAVNCEFAPDTRRLHNGDEVAVIPPVSGG